jgi:hypothetical protein
MKSRLACVTAALLSTAAVGSANGQFISSSPHAFGDGRTYVTTSAPVRFTVDSFFDVFFVMDIPSMTSPAHVPGSGFGRGRDCYCFTFWNAGEIPGPGWLLDGSLSIFDSFAGVAPDGVTQLYDVEITAMNFVDTAVVNGHRVHIRESPTLVSSGTHSVLDVGPGGGYLVSSFFDIFLEMSIDDGQTWTPADQALRMEMVPSPASGLLLVMGSVFAARGRRRR